MGEICASLFSLAAAASTITPETVLYWTFQCAQFRCWASVKTTTSILFYFQSRTLQLFSPSPPFRKQLFFEANSCSSHCQPPTDTKEEEPVSLFVGKWINHCFLCQIMSDGLYWDTWLLCHKSNTCKTLITGGLFDCFVAIWFDIPIVPLNSDFLP